ncbi:5-formyltetrahydrofolate cyclo-ligase [Caldimonas tepidiphila]|uniref:5-formyltetrahydrofolate cyclo-ligase n=1 Tax=Caldimonas tepidiphila TaxID=2315841 RepID=UPI00130080F6|nr:5-formyltetrahydrofolate cyclo-ligase [Caldimonas tepidiphila]
MSETPASRRTELRRHLLAERERFQASEAGPRAQQALGERLCEVLHALEPQLLGVYWPIRSEFNPLVALRADPLLCNLPLALPWSARTPRAMHYRRWDGRPPTGQDECGIPAPEGAEVQPDVVIAPCVGYTREGFRLGYGGGYFDRWMAAHPHVTAVGVAWSHALVEMPVEPHDQPLMLVVTEQGVVTSAD